MCVQARELFLFFAKWNKYTNMSLNTWPKIHSTFCLRNMCTNFAQYFKKYKIRIPYEWFFQLGEALKLEKFSKSEIANHWRRKIYYGVSAIWNLSPNFSVVRGIKYCILFVNRTERRFATLTLACYYTHQPRNEVSFKMFFCCQIFKLLYETFSIFMLNSSKWHA